MGWWLAGVVAVFLAVTTKSQREWMFNKQSLVSNALLLWDPHAFENEKDFERDLKQFLQKRLAPHKVQSQYGIGRTRADLMINEEILIELKVDLNSPAKIHRLVGQIDDYRSHAKHSFIVVCGSNDEDLLQNLVEKYEDDSEITILVKKPVEKA